MGKVRIYELAKELGMANKELVQKLQGMGFAVKSHSSTIEDYRVQEVRDRLLGRKSEVVTERRVQPTVIRRRKKIVDVPQPEVADEAAPAEVKDEEIELRVEPEQILEEETPAAAEKLKEEEAPVEAASEKTAPKAEEEVSLDAEAAARKAEPEPEAEAAEEKEEKLPGKKQGEPILDLAKKIKKLKKSKDEPARIISRPKVPVKPRPPQPAPAARPRPSLKAVPPLTRKVAEPPLPGIVETKKSRKTKKGKESEVRAEAVGRKRGLRRKEIIERAQLYDADNRRRPARGRKAARTAKKAHKTEITVPKAIKRRIKVMEAITVGELAKKMGVKGGDVIRKLMSLGLVAHINKAIDFDAASLVAGEFGYDVEKGAFNEEEFLHVDEGGQAESVARPPVVTVMGHVDHGKTLLLDTIRKTNVVEGEAGGITQHIGAYHVKLDNSLITFLDTPGHEAFTSMRARGAQITDIVVLVVASDDGVMQQTREAVDHARAAKVPIIIAVNKIDKPDADPERIRREMSDLGLTPESWGGDTIFADVSAKSGQGVSELLELILLQAEMLELKGVSEGRARGRIVEARLDKGRGPVATVLIQDGVLKPGDPFVCGVFNGKVRAMFDDRGQRLDMAGPSIPVEIQGITGVPQAGDELVVLEDEKQAKQVSQHRQLKQREKELIKTSKVTLESLYESIREDQTKELNLVLKADVQGSLEAIADALGKLATDVIKINLVHSSTGAISDNDIMLASASDAIVVGFNVRPNAKVQDLADREKIQIRFYNVIYRLIDEIKEAMTGLLEPIQEERILGRAEVREAFHVSKVGTIAGCAVTDGKVARGFNARLLRDDVVIYDGKIDSLKRFKDDAKEVVSGYECGIGLENYDDIKAGDTIEVYFYEEVAATLD